MMLKNLVFGLFLMITVCVSTTVSQTVRTPAKGSAERTAILNVLRIPVEKQLKQKIQFSTSTFKVQGNWAFLNGSPQNTFGGKPDYSKTSYQEAIREGAFDNNFQALLQKTGGKWKVVTYQIGCTDVCWEGWWDQYKAPRTIFPTYE